MSVNESEMLVADRDSVSMPRPGVASRTRKYTRLLESDRSLAVRYILVAGVVGVPASMLQLTVMLFLYGRIVGDYGPIALNVLWLVNFEIGLLRNFALHCAYTWRMAPTWGRLRHAHVAAAAAVVIDLAAFNAVVYVTGILPVAQLFGAGAAFGFNFAYNRIKTFASGTRQPVIDPVTL
jgi:putative flippase GtrA